MKYIAIILIRVYQITLSRILPRTCRFTPSCSQYAISVLNNHGVLKGSILSFLRILRCHPFCSGGWDPAPAPGRGFIDIVRCKPHRMFDIQQGKEYSNE